jgi:hypothetical protein
MRTTIVALLLAVLAASVASACPYQATMAQGDDQAQSQTAQTQAPAQDE